MNKNSNKILNDVIKLKPLIWRNPNKQKSERALSSFQLQYKDIVDAGKRINRFAPLIKKLFPETENGIIESPFVGIPKMKRAMEMFYKKKINGRVFLKCDSHLKVAGSVKARGGIYEVLKHAEKLVIENHLLSRKDNYAKLASGEFRRFFSGYKIAVGSTGNLGLSIGIMGATLGFKVTVHMSHDAKEWKKKLLREKGVRVIEYKTDYSQAVAEGRKQCEKDPKAHFVDDENSKDLFLGYSVAALKLKKQFQEQKISQDNSRIYAYLPCGVGGAPGGIAFGLKHVFGDDCSCFFVEPTHSPCMLVGLLTRKFNKTHVNDYDIDNITEADGLAVGSPSGMVSALADKLIDGIITVDDNELFSLLALVKNSENIKVEPSAAACFAGPHLVDSEKNAIHICWATGGLFVPERIYKKMYMKGEKIIKKLMIFRL